MKLALPLLIACALATASAQDPKPGYATTPNTSGVPFPTALPVIKENDDASHFDWKRYIGEAISEGDKVFRQHEAFSYGFTDFTEQDDLSGVLHSNSDEMTRNQIAADEAMDGCAKLEAMYRDRLKSDKKLLRVLEDFITHQRKAIEASIMLVGGSWDGGSGARVAYPAARLTAFLRYRQALLDLQESLHFQDFPKVAFPTPGRTIANGVGFRFRQKPPPAEDSPKRPKAPSVRPKQPR